MHGLFARTKKVDAESHHNFAIIPHACIDTNYTEINGVDRRVLVFVFCSARAWRRWSGG